MPENGVARTVSFEDNFRELHGRSPTPEETKKHLAFDRLAKSSSLDPATLLLIVDAGGIDRAAIFARLDRIEASLVAKNPTVQQKKTFLPKIGSPSRELYAFALALFVFGCIALFADRTPSYVPFIFLYSVAIALGVTVATALMAMYYRRGKR